ncbi:phage tail sheath subtilisin-like domain-containing protein [Dactylosporangium sp. NPDC051485]|uniref:phage tail sheath family protein n=1 Tax=Dactylosporangium sp. NPDC051485 TaxID=3154846 RepID=UPI00343410D2
MATYPMPGLYIQATAPAPAPTVRTGVPAFLGRADSGPWTVTPLARPGAFAGTYTSSGGYLAAAVAGFFANGGQRCHVVRLREDMPEADALAAGLAALEDADADLVCVPDLVTAPAWPGTGDLTAVTGRQRQVLDHCAARGDRFAVLDAVPTGSASTVLAQRAALSGPSATYGALYAPWLVAAGNVLVPPCGHVSGVYAAADDASGTQRAPAGIPLNTVLDVHVAWNTDDLAQLTTAGVNTVLALPGRGFQVWGARTVSDDPAWRDVTARRVVAEIVRRLETFMTDLVDEPNDVRLWVRIMRELTVYLDGLYQRGALRGSTADSAFFVKCDSETNPPDVRATGQVVTQVGVCLAAQAEVLVLNVVRTADGTDVQAA